MARQRPIYAAKVMLGSTINAGPGRLAAALPQLTRPQMHCADEVRRLVSDLAIDIDGAGKEYRAIAPLIPDTAEGEEPPLALQQMNPDDLERLDQGLAALEARFSRIEEEGKRLEAITRQAHRAVAAEAEGDAQRQRRKEEQVASELESPESRELMRDLLQRRDELHGLIKSMGGMSEAEIKTAKNWQEADEAPVDQLAGWATTYCGKEDAQHWVQVIRQDIATVRKGRQ